MESIPEKKHTEMHGGLPSRLRATWVFIGFAAIAVFFLITEHRAHLVGFVPYLPFLFLLACPLMHFFHHGGHGHHHGTNSGDESKGENK